MQKKISLQVLPEEAADERTIRSLIAASVSMDNSEVKGYQILKRSIDARSRQVKVNLTVNAFIKEPFSQTPRKKFLFPELHSSAKKIVIIGAGPAGLFAALHAIQHGIRPVILERGKDVRERRRDLAKLNKEGIINPESNYCFGEGGAGTYSDGKLYTRSSKRGDIREVLELFVHFGADENILYDSHPHIGTNKLPQIISAMRKQIIAAGGIIHFEKKCTGFRVEKNKISEIVTADGDMMPCESVILATGHSARDIFHLLHQQNIRIEAKPFALGVRVEHPQSLIDLIQYHCPPHTPRSPALPPASYQLVEQVDDKGVFSFCMCPGGIIATASTAPGELVVNGWSPSKRNNPFANSGMVVQVELTDVIKMIKQKELKISARENPETDPLLMMFFQESIEQSAYTAGGGKFIAPAQRLVDFCDGRNSRDLPPCSYIPGLNPALLEQVLPASIYNRLRKGFVAFGKKMKGYYTNEAVVVATESRTSSPVRLPRSPETLAHPQLINFYPCGEGAGYAGGIVSAAMDGQRVTNAIAKKYGLVL